MVRLIHKAVKSIEQAAQGLVRAPERGAPPTGGEKP